jgi:RNA polymerase sigma factor (TIGR02999 family)
MENEAKRIEGETAGEVTRLLRASRGGDREALDRVIPIVYDDLRRRAERELGREWGDRSVQPTTLVHEAYVKLAGGGALQAEDRAHFLAVAARAMRQVLVDHARQRRAVKRGSGVEPNTLNEAYAAPSVDPDQILALNDALEQLDPRQRQVVEYRFFGGLEEREIAELLGVTERTVRRDWVKARAWLYRILYGMPEG